MSLLEIRHQQRGRMCSYPPCTSAIHQVHLARACSLEKKEPPPPRPPRGDRLTDEGWSRYFQGNNASNLAHMSTGQSTYLSQDSASDYRNSAYPHGSAEVAPLSLGRFSNGRQLNHVA